MPGQNQERVAFNETIQCSIADPFQLGHVCGNVLREPVGPGNSGSSGTSWLLDDALHALALAEKRLFGIQRENIGLRENNKHLMEALDGASRRAVAAVRVSQHDRLTGLPNRLLLIKRLQLAIRHAAERKSQLALVFIDLDGFKAVNDQYGHQVADRLLSAVGARIAASVRAEDIACRYGGDEFVALLTNLNDPAIAGRIMEKIRQDICECYSINGFEIHVGASAGLSMYPGDGERFDVLLQHADAAMFRDKATRRATIRLCEMNEIADAGG